PPPSEVEQYVISIMPAGTNQERTLNARNSTETLFENLNPGTEYTITVIARTSDTRYDDSLSYTVTEMTAVASGLRLRLRVFLEGPLQ
ncbi:MAG: fibronectin type III domain-containing protein, partial [Candidatus Oxydemutatoraceae bacterium WSBS_2016_MAG_OTU14]